jgi:hypothetical protein
MWDCSKNFRTFALSVCFLLGFLLSAPPAFAQSARLSGHVVDEQGATIPGATVTLTHRGTGSTHTSVTTLRGLYVFPSVLPGEYELRVQADNFHDATVSKLALEVNEDTQLNVTLLVGSRTESVSVTAPLTGSRDGSVGAVIDRSTLERMPLNGGTFHSLIELAPGVVSAPTATGSFSVNGQRPDTNYFTVDGVSANVGIDSTFALSGSAAGQAAATTITGGYNALSAVEGTQEFRVQTSTFAPEYGRTPGAQVSIVTASGSNTFRGSAFYRLRDDAFDANNWFLNSTGVEATPLHQDMFGGGFGGPLVRNRVFYFGTYEGLHLQQPDTLITAVPTLDARNKAPATTRALLDAYPQPTGGVLGANTAEFAKGISETTRSDVASARVDTSLGRITNIFARYNDGPSHLASDNVIRQDTINRHLRTLTAGAAYTPSARAFVDLRVNYSTNHLVSRLDSTVPLLSLGLFPDGVLETPNETRIQVAESSLSFWRGDTTTNEQQQWNAVGSLTYLIGSHDTKVGIDYRELNPSTQQPKQTMFLLFNTFDDVIKGVGSRLTMDRRTGVRATFRNVSLYAQDTWRMTPRLSVTYGFRWDVNPAPSFPSSLAPPTPVNFGDPAALDLSTNRGGSLYSTRYTNIAPRIGGSYAVDREGRLLVRAGIGRFYDLGQQSASQILNGGLYPNATRLTTTNVALPLTAQALAGLPLTFGTPPYAGVIYLVDPNLRAPVTTQWNTSVAYQLGSGDVFTVSYVAARGHDLASSSLYLAPNPRFTGTVRALGNAGHSEYDSLQVQYRRRASQNVLVTAAYTLASAKDDNSDTITAQVPPERGVTDEWGPASFDIRHSFTAAVSWTPRFAEGATLGHIVNGWRFDVFGRARSAVPLTVYTGRDTLGVGSTTVVRPDLVPGQSIWIDDNTAPGGRRLNKDAFVAPLNGRQGTLGRNSIRGFAAGQIDLGISRVLDLSRGLRLELRAEAFNVFNIPQFGNPNTTLSSALFGRSTSTLNILPNGGNGDQLNGLYQWGGPRSLELSTTLRF